MNKKIKLLALATTTLLLMSGSCEDEFLSVEDKAKKASDEFCECMKKNTLSKCKDKLNDKYSYYADDDDFIKTFNRVNDCGATIYKEKK